MFAQTYRRIDLALEQLDAALMLFLEHCALAAVITRAGAAEEVLSKEGSRRGWQVALDRRLNRYAALDRKYGEPRLTPVALQMIEQAANGRGKAAPGSGHAIARGFRPLVAQRLSDVDVGTLGELVVYCNRRGGSWW